MASSSSSMLVAAVLATLVVSAWCAAPQVTFTAAKGSDKKMLALQIKYDDKEGDALEEVAIKEQGSNEWLALTKGAGDVWGIKSKKPLKGPFKLRFVTKNGRMFNQKATADFKVDTTQGHNLDVDVY